MNPSTLQSWLAIAGFFLLWGSSLYALIRRNAKEKSDLLAIISKNSTDIDRVGEKVNTTNAVCGKHDESIRALQLEQRTSIDDRTAMREKIAGNTSAIISIREDIQSDRLAVMAQLHNNERAASERDAVTREQLAAIKERLNIEQMINSVVRNMQASS